MDLRKKVMNAGVKVRHCQHKFSLFRVFTFRQLSGCNWRINLVRMKKMKNTSVLSAMQTFTFLW